MNLFGGLDPQRALTCFYHAGCPDGIGGAYAIYAALEPQLAAGLHASWTAGEPEPQDGPCFEGVSPGAPHPVGRNAADRHVVYVDVVPAGETLQAVMEVARSVTILDHHRSARRTLTALGLFDAGAPNRVLVYAEDRSGAQLAWDWAHPGRVRPLVLDYIGDRDLWRFALPASREINKALFVEGHTRSILALADFVARGGLTPAHTERGGHYAVVDNQTVARLAKRAHRMAVSARTPGNAEPRVLETLVVNSPVLPSELGEALMAGAPPDVHFAIVWSYDFKNDEVWASARTNRPDVDLSVIVPGLMGAKPGGGGHPRAAGFAVAGGGIRAIQWHEQPESVECPECPV
jgi:hypothetical protein